ncbi:GntR family transcriptional regulator [Murinocardiopsis flavida]|uniref:GntR family transcriptional regulator n=1 Tax=Murinocardiopsis flavida TaxID=645275 RepID=A0A2P8DEI7_9ACTN|nr:GntR family transcriptional regulator [Murinocardiopsis flavida]PSK95641.1 GntR family transcriptional regulator [Murinocardiopsis flavida]
MARWETITGELREAIIRGEIAPGTTLPRETDLEERYGASRTTVRRAVEELEAEGLVEKVRRRGTVVRRSPARTRLTRSRRVYRDDIGYFFDRTAQGWRALETPTITRVPAPADVARLLGVEPGGDVTARSRIMGEPDTGEATQVAVSYLSPDAVAELPVLAEPDTGPGGIYDRMEEAGHSPLEWEEAISARMPSPEEARLLALAPGVPVLRIVRTTRTPGGRVLEVNATVLSAERFEIGYAIDRDTSATP